MEWTGKISDHTVLPSDLSVTGSETREGVRTGAQQADPVPVLHWQGLLCRQ